MVGLAIGRGASDRRAGRGALDRDRLRVRVVREIGAGARDLGGGGVRAGVGLVGPRVVARRRVGPVEAERDWAVVPAGRVGIAARLRRIARGPGSYVAQRLHDIGESSRLVDSASLDQRVTV